MCIYMFIRIPNPCSWWLFAGGKVSLAKVADSLCTFMVAIAWLVN